jgi:serine/threonine protein phosphatase PrpC
MQLMTHHVTSRGGRPVNDDALKEVIQQKFALLALADGLGGHGGSALAAHQCLETIASAFSPAPGLPDAALQTMVEEADRAVATLRRDQRNPPSSMRTTLAFFAIFGNDARWAHVGDSRVYWFRHNVLMQRTRDHSVSEFVMGLPDRTSVTPPDKANRHRLLRAVGAGEGCRAEPATLLSGCRRTMRSYYAAMAFGVSCLILRSRGAWRRPPPLSSGAPLWNKGCMST